MRNRILVAVTLACTLPSLTSAATFSVKVNPDGSFSPPVVTIASGDTVEWTLTGPSDSIIPVNWDGVSGGVCSAVKPYSATDPNDLTGPMPLAVSGIFALQDGFPRVNNSGAYETVDGTSSGPGALPGGTEQTQTIIDNGQAAHGTLFAVAHNGLQTKKTDNCLLTPNAVGCPNKWVLQEGLEGQVTGWQTTNVEKVANAADTDSALQNALSNSQGVYVELYEERYWEAAHQPNGVIDPLGSGRTMAQWTTQFHNRRRSLFPAIPEPFPTTYRHTFTRTLVQPSGNQTFYYVHGSKCGVGSAAPAAVIVLPPGGTPPRRRAARH